VSGWVREYTLGVDAMQIEAEKREAAWTYQGVKATCRFWALKPLKGPQGGLQTTLISVLGGDFSLVFASAVGVLSHRFWLLLLSCSLFSSTNIYDGRSLIFLLFQPFRLLFSIMRPPTFS